MALRLHVLHMKLIICADDPLSIEAAFLVQIVPEAAAVTQDVSVGIVEEYCLAGAIFLRVSGTKDT